MKNLLLIPLLIVLSSCASVKTGNDPVLVRAESVTATAFDTFDSFLKLERNQESYVKANAPQVHQFANSLRRNAADWLKTARITTEAYRTNRTDENRANLNTAIAVVQAALSQVTVYTSQLNQVSP